MKWAILAALSTFWSTWDLKNDIGLRFDEPLKYGIFSEFYT